MGSLLTIFPVALFVVGVAMILYLLCKRNLKVGIILTVLILPATVYFAIWFSKLLLLYGL